MIIIIMIMMIMIIMIIITIIITIMIIIITIRSNKKLTMQCNAIIKVIIIMIMIMMIIIIMITMITIITIIITIKKIITRSNKKLTGCNAMQQFAGVDLIRANVTFMLLFSNKCDFPTSVTQQRIFPMFLLHLTFIQLLFALSHSHQPQGTQTSNILILAKH